MYWGYSKALLASIAVIAVGMLLVQQIYLKFLDRSDNVQRISLALFVVLLSLLVGGCSSRKKINHIFDTYEIETTEKIPYVYYDKLALDNLIIDFGEILDENKYNWLFHEVYVIQNNTIWFGFSDIGSNENGSRQWNIASMNVDSKELNICYSGEFCLGFETDKVYVQNNNHSNESHQNDNGFYYNGKIILTDHVKTVEYDLQTKKSTEFMAGSYEYPTLEIEAEIVDHHTISFSKENKQKVFDVNHGKQKSNVFEKLYELEKEKNWQGKSYLSKLFDKVQIVNNQIYIICRVYNWDGETHAIVFQYDYDTNSCKYAFHCFMDDIIGNDLYVVPII